MVTSVTAAPGIRKIRRDEQKSFDSKKKNAKGFFAQILEEAAKDTKREVINCHTTTYGRDSKIQTFLYQTREYRY